MQSLGNDRVEFSGTQWKYDGVAYMILKQSLDNFSVCNRSGTGQAGEVGLM
ncbi:hypothetical protein Pan161_37240 [Gimesia algae]|uniref:Uncharacterized protein n=1 Tax=Gimesia algae TaxID=2527971 RepID=A0A517VGD4_9PLAN|nr:hypothetical protein Pan161_37240 [Gimesia algae]